MGSLGCVGRRAATAPGASRGGGIDTRQHGRAANGPTSTALAVAPHRKVPVNAPPLRPVMGVCPGRTTSRSSSACDTPA